MNWLNKYAMSFKMGVKNAMEYRVNFLLSLISAIFPIVIQFFLWTAIFESSPNSKVYGYTYAQMISYSILAAIVSKLVATGFEWDILNDVKNGGLNKFIVQPIGYFLYRISCFLGYKLMHISVGIVIASSVLAFVSFRLDLTIEAPRALLFALSILLALLLNFLIFFCISTVAFWMNEIWAVIFIGNVLVNIASGGIFPLDIFGPKVLRVMDFLPFKYIIYQPVNIITGRMEYSTIYNGMAIQLVWSILLVFFCRILWNAGLKKYVAVGG